MSVLANLVHRSGDNRARLKDNNFDVLRLIFATMVVFFHIGILSGESSLQWTQKISATFAVQAFFVVSGFLVAMSYENSTSLKSYASKRLRRIAPAYVAIVLLSAILLSMFSTLSVREYFTSTQFWRYLGFNLVLSNFSAPVLPGVFEDNLIHEVNGSLWTIKIEVAFYFSVPLIVSAVRRYGYRSALAAIFMASLAWKLGFLFAADTTGQEIFRKLAKQLPGQLAFFAGGAWAYYRTRDGLPVRFWWALVGCAAYGLTSGLANEIVAPAAVTLVVYWAATGPVRLPKLGKYGDFSYGVYLYHFPIVQVAISMGLLNYGAVPMLVAVVLFVAVASVLSWELVEKKFLIRRFDNTAGLI